MDAPMELLGLSTKTYNYFLRAGAHTFWDVADICNGKRSKKNIPEKCIREAQEALKLQETFLGVKLFR